MKERYGDVEMEWNGRTGMDGMEWKEGMDFSIMLYLKGKKVKWKLTVDMTTTSILTDLDGKRKKEI